MTQPAFESIARARNARPESFFTDPVRGALPIDAVLGILLQLGDTDQALAELDEYLGSSVGYWSLDGLSRDPRLDAFRDDPRFDALSEKHRRR